MPSITCTSSFLVIAAVISTLSLSGCRYAHNTYSSVHDSLSQQLFTQASIRLQRCVDHGYSQSQQQCISKAKEIESTGMTILEYYRAEDSRKKHKEYVQQLQKKRDSSSPWDRLSLAGAIALGDIPALKEGEIEEHLEFAFIGFGECAKGADIACMVQYGRMVLNGTDLLVGKPKEDAKNKALYWLSLSARYGSKEARKTLLTIGEEIPTPDLAMELLQREANDQATRKYQEEIEAIDRLTKEVRYSNYQMSLQSFFPRMATCTSNSIGTYVYTSCY